MTICIINPNVLRNDARREVSADEAVVFADADFLIIPHTMWEMIGKIYRITE